MRSLKLNAPKVARQPRTAERPSVSTPPRSGGIVPPAKARPRVGDSFEKPGAKGHGGKRGGAVFEPGSPKSPRAPTGSTRAGQVGGKVQLPPELEARLKKAGEELAVRLGPNAKLSTIRREAIAIVKSMNVPHAFFGQSVHAVTRACRGVGASGLRPLGDD